MSLLNFVQTLTYPVTDKYDLGYIEHFYDRLFSPRQTSVRRLLEIGIHYGHSMRLWRDYFINADIYGYDINNCSSVNNQERMYPVYSNAYSLNVVNGLEPKSFDIVIDDGPHTLESLEFFCKHYIKLVRPGGIFVVEDIIDTAWTPRLLEIIGSAGHVDVIHMAGLARTEHLKKLWTPGLDVIIVEV